MMKTSQTGAKSGSKRAQDLYSQW